jgi:copper chaperone CopZ
MTTVTYDVPNISCGHCVHTIKTELAELDGVAKVEASESDQRVVVDYEPPATEEQLVAVLKEINYPPAA